MSTTQSLNHPIDLTVSTGRRRNALLRSLRQVGPLSRVELADLTGISKPSVTRLTLALIEDGLVVEDGFGASTPIGGKPRSMLRLRGAALAAIGCTMKPGVVAAGLSGFDGSIESRSVVHFDPAEAPEIVLQHMIRAIQEVAESNAATSRPLVGVGVGVPGMVNSAGEVFMARMIGWGGVPVREALSTALELQVQVDNSARLNTLAEMRFGAARTADSAVVVDLSDGIAAGVIIRGALWRGVHSLAGEIGHTHWGTSGTACRCGGSSCLEHTASTARLLQDLVDHGALDASSGDVDVLEIAQRLDEPTIWRAVAAHGQVVADAISDIVLTYDPGLVLLRGGSAQLGPRFTELLRTKVANRFAAFDGVDPTILTSDLGPNADLLGAVSLVLSSAWGFEAADQR